MFQINSENLNKINFLNILIALIPLTLIIGNLASNLNIIFIIVTGTIIFGKEIFFVKKKIYGLLIYSFFFFLIITTFFNNFNKLEVNSLYQINIYKSLIYLRFLMLFLVINKMIEKNHLDFYLFFISSSLFSTLLACDIIIQTIFGVDLIGNPITLARPSGFFGEENIAGGYLQKFYFFLICLLILKFKNKPNELIYSMFVFFFITLILTGNRMPTLIFIFSFILFCLFEKKIKEIFVIILIFFLTIFFLLKYPIIERSNIQIKKFYQETTSIIKIAPELFINNYYDKKIETYDYNYLIHFNSGIQIWKKNKIFGNGLKSFRIKCKYEPFNTCNNHPHNYLIEILVDTGLIGFCLIYCLFILGIINFFKLIKNKTNKKTKIIHTLFFIIIFFELFPFRSTGSFFTTSNSIFIYLVLPMFLNLQNIKFKDNSYKLTKLLKLQR